jgi:uncharacterized membrane protein
LDGRGEKSRRPPSEPRAPQNSEPAGKGQPARQGMAGGTRSAGRRAYSDLSVVDRLVYFSDGVFAIAITLLVLGLDMPAGLTEADMNGALRGLGPELFSFALSFFVIGRFWVGHLWIFRQVRRCDGPVLLLNTLFLLSIAFLPFPTALLGEYMHYRSAMIVYAASVSLAGLLFTLVWASVSYRSALLTEDLDSDVRRMLLLRFLFVPAVFLASIPVVLANLRHAAAAMWIILPLTQFLVTRWQAHRSG